MNNPLFPPDNHQPADNDSLSAGILPPNQTDSATKTAADLIREKVARIYAQEPNAQIELAEAKAATVKSPHQQFMSELQTSGKDLATIQTDWHNYYIALSDDEKRQVWQEFYDSNVNTNILQPSSAPAEHLAAHKNLIIDQGRQRNLRPIKLDLRKATEIRSTIRNHITAGGKLQPKHHIQSLLFGLGLGMIVVIIFLFGFFNEVIIAPFIQPSRHASATPLIIDSNSIAPTQAPEVIIPKINVEIPVNYTETSTDENVIENDLQSGVVHYPTTSLPGQNGNTAYFGHSSNNIFSKGKYKFAFVLLHELVPGDTFYLTNNGKLYVYKVFSKTIVDPSDVGVLDPVAGHSATATLITCDPPGTSLRRLIIVGDQISPDPSSNGTSPAIMTSGLRPPTVLPSEGPTLWGHWWATAYGKTVTILILIIGLGITIRRLSRKLQKL